MAILVDRIADDRCAVVRLCDTSNRNAFSPALGRGLLDAYSLLNDDSGVSCIGLEAEGDTFSVGGNVKTFAARIADGSLRDLIEESIVLFDAVIRAMVGSRKLTFAALEGPVAGGGLSLAASCDVRLCHPGTRFVGGFVGIGLPPDTGSGWLLSRIMGPDRAREFLLTNRVMTASEALECGLVHAIVDDPRAEMRARMVALSGVAVNAVARGKRLMRVAPLLSLDEYLAVEEPLVLESIVDEEYLERVRRFVDKPS